MDGELDKAALYYADGIVDKEDSMMCKAAFEAGAKWESERVKFRLNTILECKLFPLIGLL